MRRTLKLLAVFLVGIPSVVEAQNVNERDLLPSAVQILNGSDADLAFRASYEGDRNWIRYRLSKREIKLIKIKGNSYLVIEICTESVGNSTSCKKYRLEKSKRYQIYWNEEQSLWDLVEVSSG